MRTIESNNTRFKKGGVPLTIRFALLQMDIVFGEPDPNFKKAKQLIEKAMEKKPDVLVLPELWTTGYDLERLDQIADKDGLRTKAFFSELANHYSVNIIGGSVAIQKTDGVYNTLLAFNREGTCIKEYAKVHLFRLMREEQFLQPGKDESLFELEGLPASGMICYDIRFPEWLRVHALKGSGLFIVPAEWPTPRIDHWRTLLISRAIENQSFVVACNRVGRDPENAFGGHSLVISPWGEVLAEAAGDEEILISDIEPDTLADFRSRIPVFEDRRPKLYGDLFKNTSVPLDSKK